MIHILRQYIAYGREAASLPLAPNMCRLLGRSYAAVFMLALMAVIVPRALQAQTEPQSSLYDQPLSTMRQAVTSDLVEAGGGLICSSYNQFMVKRLDSGSPTGDISITIVPKIAGSKSVVCSAEHAAGDISIEGDGFSFGGVKGNFIILFAADPNGAVPFKVYDRRTANLLYADSTDVRGLKFIANEGDTLHMRFRRNVNITCSIPKDGQTCWAKAAREVHLAIAVASLPAPVEACTGVYKQQKASLDDPSIIVYDVDLVVAPHRRANVLSRGAVSCEPLP